MKILIVSNLYPPHYLGGYEIHCAQVAEALRESGHDVRVLASTYGLPGTDGKGGNNPAEIHRSVPVYRRLHQYAFPPQPRRWPWVPMQARHELADARHFMALLNEFQPDVVNWWNLNGLTKLILPLPAQHGIPDVHAIDDNWLIHEYGADGGLASALWDAVWNGRWGPRVLRPLLRAAGNRWEVRVAREGLPTRSLAHVPAHACFLSEYLRRHHEEAGIRFPSTEVIHGGVQVERFYAPRASALDPSQPVRILYAGQLTPDRGLHTLVDAIAGLAPGIQSQVRLTVVGGGRESYVTSVKEQLHSAGLGDRASFLGRIGNRELPEVYKSHDVLVFASGRSEGFGFVNVEAMMAGCAVLTTGSGGSMEIALAAGLPRFPAGDSRALGLLIEKLVSDRGELGRLAARGQEVALAEFTFERMMAKWNECLQRVCELPRFQTAGAAQAATVPGK